MWIDLPPFIYRMDRHEAIVAVPAIWFGPAVVAAVATSWLTGRQGRGVGAGIAAGIGVAGVAGVLGCCAGPVMLLSPLFGAIAAVVTVLRSE